MAAFSAATSRWLPAGRLCAASAAITLFSGRMVWSSGPRQLTFGLVAAALTYGVGAAIGVTVAG